MTAKAQPGEYLLEVRDLSVSFDTLRGSLTAVDRISFDVRAGETLGIVGESGCGKSITSLALMGLLPPNGRLQAEQLSFDGQDLRMLPEADRRHLRGGKMGMIFQDPMSSLNPSFTVEFQISEALNAHSGGSQAERRAATLALLNQVGIPDAERRLRSYPHQLSGGMCQRVMIAMAIACQPKLLIADEPTTALDVTIQAQILDLLGSLKEQRGMSLILITHDIGVVSSMADRIAVMYAGQIVEAGATREVIANPKHPYTEALLGCMPGSNLQLGHRTKLPSIPGMVPDLVHRPPGCQLSPRCRYVDESCRAAEPPWLDGAKCIRPLGRKP